MGRNLGDFHNRDDAGISELAFKRGSQLVTALNRSPHGCQNRLAVWTVVVVSGREDLNLRPHGPELCALAEVTRCPDLP
jgi:hypothetical protein